MVNMEMMEMADFVICLRGKKSDFFDDDITDKCCKCKKWIHYRPYMPKKPKKICMECMNEHLPVKYYKELNKYES